MVEASEMLISHAFGHLERKESLSKLDGKMDLGNISITEIEMDYGALSRDPDKTKAFFFIRNHEGLEVPENYKSDFETEDVHDVKKLEELKNR